MFNLDLNRALYRKAYLIRMAEEKIRKHYLEDEMKTPTHLSIGEEAIVAGICQALRTEDQIFSTYRGHGVYLARTEETDGFFAELFGKVTGVSKGKTGSMHLHSAEMGFLGSSAVVATTIPVAVGASYVNKYKNNGKIVVSFFGDGALEEGVFWESLNVACLMKLPILFVCEDNGLAIHSHLKNRQAFKSITDIVSQFGCPVFKEGSTDPEVIYTLTQSAIDKIKTTSIPVFLHLNYYRYYEHVGIHPDFKSGYRSEDEFKEWIQKDPINQQRQKLLWMGCVESQIVELERKILNQIDQSFLQAKEAPFPQKSELYEDVYA